MDSAAQTTRLILELPPGDWRATWMDPKTGAVRSRDSFRHSGGVRDLASPSYTEDVALRLDRR